MGADIIQIFLNHLTFKDMWECFDDFVTLPANAILIFPVLNDLIRTSFPEYKMVQDVADPWRNHAIIEHFCPLLT